MQKTNRECSIRNLADKEVDIKPDLDVMNGTAIRWTAGVAGTTKKAFIDNTANKFAIAFVPSIDMNHHWQQDRWVDQPMGQHEPSSGHWLPFESCLLPKLWPISWASVSTVNCHKPLSSSTPEEWLGLHMVPTHARPVVPPLRSMVEKR